MSRFYNFMHSIGKENKTHVPGKRIKQFFTNSKQLVVDMKALNVRNFIQNSSFRYSSSININLFIGLFLGLVVNF